MIFRNVIITIAASVAVATPAVADSQSIRSNSDVVQEICHADKSCDRLYKFIEPNDKVSYQWVRHMTDGTMVFYFEDGRTLVMPYQSKASSILAQTFPSMLGSITNGISAALAGSLTHRTHADYNTAIATSEAASQVTIPVVVEGVSVKVDPEDK